MKQIRNIREVYNVLGGIDGVARAVPGCNWKTAWHWLGRTEVFPANAYTYIQKALSKHDAVAVDSLFARRKARAKAKAA